MLALVGDDDHRVGFDDVERIAGDLQLLGARPPLCSLAKRLAKLGEGDLAFERSNERALRLAQELARVVVGDEPAEPGIGRGRAPNALAREMAKGDVVGHVRPGSSRIRG